MIWTKELRIPLIPATDSKPASHSSGNQATVTVQTLPATAIGLRRWPSVLDWKLSVESEWPLGALEKYLPVGHAGKDIEKLIELVSEPDWWDALPADGKVELQTICEAIPF